MSVEKINEKRKQQLTLSLPEPDHNTTMTKDQESGTTKAAASDGAEAKGTEAAPAPATEAIEEDDAFEEFEPSAWGAHDEEAEDVQQWQVRGSG